MKKLSYFSIAGAVALTAMLAGCNGSLMSLDVTNNIALNTYSQRLDGGHYY